MSVSAELCSGQFHILPDGKRMRYALFDPQQPPRGTMLVAPGRREFIEKKYFETGPEFLGRGYRLIVFEWRGQGLSSRFFGGEKRQYDHVVDFDHYLDDLDSFYKNIVSQHHAGSLVVAGHSIGGHLVLRWLAERQKKDIKAAILTAPMLALGPRAAQALASGIDGLALRLGQAETYVWGQSNYGPRERQFKGNPLTQDPERFALIERYFDAYPDLQIGGVTWGWLAAALQSMRLTRQPTYLRQVKVPVLGLTGSQDKVTPPFELARYLSHLPDVRNAIIPGALHDVMNELEAYRAKAWRHIDEFLAEI